MIVSARAKVSTTAATMPTDTSGSAAASSGDRAGRTTINPTRRGIRFRQPQDLVEYLGGIKQCQKYPRR